MTLPAALAVLADDLTGAADCAARARTAGLPAAIWLRPPAAPLPLGLTALTSDSRGLPPAEAAGATRRAAAPLAREPGVRWYKKIDSTLRGNLGAELDALLDELGAPCALVAPAFPAQGRGLAGGRLAYAGAPPLSLVKLLAAQSRKRVALVELAAVRGGVAATAAALSQAHDAGARLLTADAESDADLATLLAACQAVLPNALLCGSAGLAGILAAAVASAHPALYVPASPLPAARRVLAAIGSGSPAAHAQIAALIAAGAIELDFSGQAPPPTTGCAVLHLPPPPPTALLDGPDARQEAARLARAVQAAVAAWQPGALILSGGDTAAAVLAALGVARLEVAAELLPGMPLCHMGPSLPSVALKAGNHGAPDALVRLCDMLAGRIPPREN